MTDKMLETLDLKTFLTLYAFKDLVLDKDNLPKSEPKAVRIYFDLTNTQIWFELSISDLIQKNNMLTAIIQDDILNMAVVGFYVHNNKLCITVANVPTSKEPDSFNFGDDYNGDAQA